MTDITWGTFILFACSVVFGLCFAFFLIPETKGISLEDMDLLFSRKGMPRTWRRQTNDIIAQRRAGEEGHSKDAKGANSVIAEHQEKA